MPEESNQPNQDQVQEAEAFLLKHYSDILESEEDMDEWFTMIERGVDPLTAATYIRGKR